MVERINDQALLKKHELLTGQIKGDAFGLPVTKLEERMQNQLNKIKTDPLLPKVVRDSIVNMLSGRLDALHVAHQDALTYYVEYLSNNKGWHTLEENHHWLHVYIETDMEFLK